MKTNEASEQSVPMQLEYNVHHTRFHCVCHFRLVHFKSPFSHWKYEYYFCLLFSHFVSLCSVLCALRSNLIILLNIADSRGTATKQKKKKWERIKRRRRISLWRKFINLWIVLLRQVIYYWNLNCEINITNEKKKKLTKRNECKNMNRHSGEVVII